MSVIVTDTGFEADDWIHDFVTFDHLAANRDSAVVSVDLASDTNPAELPQLVDGVDMVRIDFPSFADGRGFTLARRLRLLGFQGRLRAKGHVISEQYTMARRSGFDEVEISDDLAQRQPWELWQTRANWQENDYQARVRGNA
ncbi:DUF934 domain-containing protein [Actibacterium pelagium]|uniref:Oxidoreductase n=1 Tax=Actibacterium pelagium TaxID=2029103 RepID=A0A917AER7_9RHOB|nr:DUF934 domain-containing protein [Actibacterium pelagium]GGE47666.1 hypothetical protein GCM10011517_14360 [Actibacterium pelagium]